MGTTGHASNRTVDYGASSAAGVIMWQKLDQWMQMTVAAISFVSPERVLEVDKEKRWVDRAGNQIHDLRRISARSQITAFASILSPRQAPAGLRRVIHSRHIYPDYSLRRSLYAYHQLLYPRCPRARPTHVVLSRTRRVGVYANHMI